jgi:hypothetical protein
MVRWRLQPRVLIHRTAKRVKTLRAVLSQFDVQCPNLPLQAPVLSIAKNVQVSELGQCPCVPCASLTKLTVL